MISCPFKQTKPTSCLLYILAVGLDCCIPVHHTLFVVEYSKIDTSGVRPTKGDELENQFKPQDRPFHVKYQKSSRTFNKRLCARKSLNDIPVGQCNRLTELRPDFSSVFQSTLICHIKNIHFGRFYLGLIFKPECVKSLPDMVRCGNSEIRNS